MALASGGSVSVGVDGCRGGWFAVALTDTEADFAMASELAPLLERWAAARIVLVDMPIGLVREGRREVESAARRLLGRPRAASVFSVPVRAAVYASSYAQACELNRRYAGCAISRQAWHLTPRIREVDGLLAARPALRAQVREAHPELCFAGLAGAPMAHRKKDAEGALERRAVLRRHWPRCNEVIDRALAETLRRDVQADDIVDAFVLAVSGRHPLVTIPGDGDGSRGQMSYPQPDLRARQYQGELGT